MSEIILVDWDELVGVPAEFPPLAHDHDSRYYTESEADTLLAAKVATNDARLSDARAPLAHAHAISDVTALQATLDGKADDADLALYLPKALVDAKGDLPVGTADNTVARKAAGANGTFLQSQSGQADGLVWTVLADADIPSTIARDSEVTATIAAHEALADPHTGYQRETEKGVAGGYAGLDGSGKVPAAQLPPSGGGVSWSDLFVPMAWQGAANLTAVTVFVTNTTYLLYLGQAQAAYTSANVRCRVGTAAAGAATWAEIGIFTGNLPAFGAAGSLTRRGFLSIAGQVTTGLKDYAITGLTGINPGDDVWLAVGGQHATTQFQLRAGLADDLQSGAMQQFAGRLSTAASPVASAVSAATLAVPMVRVRFA